MNIFSLIKSKLSILDVVGQYTKFKKAGQYYKAVCPFHAERTASFAVSPLKNIFYCFGCHVGGDVISFIAKIEHYSQLEAARHLIQQFNIEVPQEVEWHGEVGREEKKKRYFELCELVAKWCHEKLLKSIKAKNYLKERGIDKQSFQWFNVGYFPGGSRAISSLKAELQERNFLIQDLLEAKILMAGNRGDYSPFEERIIFPIYDQIGRCCGFGGRVFLPDDTRAKYYNSHESEFFNKGSLLFGLDKAKKAIVREESVLLVEGYTDCVALKQYGWHNCVATLGTACSLPHLKQLSRYAKKLYILFDGDEAGKKAIFRLTQLCWEVDLDLFVVSLPVGADPDSFLQKGGDLSDRIKNAEDIFDFFIRSLGEQFRQKGLQERLALTRHFTATIARLDDPLKRDFLIYKAAGAFDIPVGTLQQEVSGVLQDQKIKKDVDAIQAPDLLAQVTLLEKRLFSAILNTVGSLGQEDAAYLTRYLSQPLAGVLTKILAVGDKGYLSFERMYEILEEEEKQWVSGILLEWPCEDNQTRESLMAQFAKRQWKKMVSEVTTKLKYAHQNNDQKEIALLLQELQDLKSKLLGRGLI